MYTIFISFNSTNSNSTKEYYSIPISLISIEISEEKCELTVSDSIQCIRNTIN